jgi:hypothetical protein
MEYDKVSAWAMAFEPQPGTGICIAGEIFREFMAAKTECQIDLVNRTALVRDPYARWCGRRGVVRPLPIPIIPPNFSYRIFCE